MLLELIKIALDVALINVGVVQEESLPGISLGFYYFSDKLTLKMHSIYF